MMNRYTIKDTISEELYPGFTAYLLHTNLATYSYVDVAEGAVLPLHSHAEEQVLHLLEGTLEVTVEGKTQICNPGDVVVIPPHAKHTVTGITRCWALDVFTPVREAYRDLGKRV